MQLQPRTEAFEYGSLPLHALCPQLDGHTTLLAMHKRLLAKSTANSAGQSKQQCRTLGGLQKDWAFADWVQTCR
jgi:hypothetical protein